MEKTRKIFISDIHLSSEALYSDTKNVSWYKPSEHDERLLGFLDNYVLANKDIIKDFILLGDVFNTWVCPVDQDPPTYQQIFRANKAVMDRFKAIVRAGINLFYVNGNHDFDLRPDVFKKAVKGIQPIRYYRSGLIHAEHGSRFDIYNKPDFYTDPAYGRPIGYYISRLVSSINDGSYGLLDLASYLDDIIEAAFTPQNIFSTIIEGLAEQVGMTNADYIRMPNKQKITIPELKERYDKLSNVYNVSELVNDLYQRRYLNGPADRICQRYDYKIVVFGHTHNALIDKDFFLVKDRIYANSGTWCKKHAYCVEIDKPVESGNPIQVFLHRIDQKGKVEHTEKEEL